MVREIYKQYECGKILFDLFPVMKEKSIKEIKKQLRQISEISDVKSLLCQDDK